MNPEELKKMVLPLFNEARESASICITTRKTAQRRKQSTITNQQSKGNRKSPIANRQSAVQKIREGELWEKLY